ncbi:hypothetical protein ABZ471_44745 [Streptomyces sp. NPDC005728]|uniref:hypothetical protein n=1 Tax=Streptomyces sp. NPDC005728 TaxID=3157054 RepID=UPI00340B13F9
MLFEAVTGAGSCAAGADVEERAEVAALLVAGQFGVDAQADVAKLFQSALPEVGQALGGYAQGAAGLGGSALLHNGVPQDGLGALRELVERPSRRADVPGRRAGVHGGLRDGWMGGDGVRLPVQPFEEVGGDFSAAYRAGPQFGGLLDEKEQVVRRGLRRVRRSTNVAHCAMEGLKRQGWCGFVGRTQPGIVEQGGKVTSAQLGRSFPDALPADPGVLRARPLFRRYGWLPVRRY